MKRLMAMSAVLMVLLSACGLLMDEVTWARRVTHLEIPRDAKVIMRTHESGGFLSEGAKLVLELSTEAYAALEKEAATKGYLPIDATVDTLFLGDRIAANGLYFRHPPPSGGPGGGYWMTVVLNPTTRRLLIRYDTT